MNKKEAWNYVVEHANIIYANLISDMKADILRDNISDHGIDFEKMSKLQLRQYVEDQILSDGFLIAKEEEKWQVDRKFGRKVN